MAIRVLVVDDDPWILRMVTATLEKRGYAVETARDGRSALEIAYARPPDVVVTDVMMPVMDGWTLVGHLRSTPALAAVPVIVLTALGKEEGRLAQLGLPSDAYLAKPFRFEELERRVSAAVNPRAADSGAHAGTPASGVYPMPMPGGNTAGLGSGIHAIPAAPSGMIPVGPNPQSGVHPMPYPQGYPGYPPQGYPGYPPPGYAGYPPPGYAYPAAPPGYAYAPGYPAGYAPMPAPPSAAPAPTPAPAPPAPAIEQDPPNKRPTGEHAASRRTTALNGKLEQLGLSSLLVMMEMERKDGVLSLKHGTSGTIGRIFLRNGQVVSARLEGMPAIGGRECVYEMLSWDRGTFSFSATPVDMEDSVQSSTTHLLMEGARLIDEARRDEGR